MIDLDILGSFLKQIPPNKKNTTDAKIKINESFIISRSYNCFIFNRNNEPKNSRKLNFLLFSIENLFIFFI